MTYGYTTTGFVLPTFQQLWDDFQARVNARTGETVNIDPDSVVGKLLGAFVQQQLQAWQAFGQLHAGLHPDAATGVYLDQLAGIVLKRRLPAARSRVELTLGSTSGVTIPRGSLLVPPDRTWRAEVLAETTIPAGETVTIEARATADGPFAAAAGVAWEFLTTFVGYDKVDSIVAAAAEPGRYRETDDQLRLRLLSEEFAATGGTEAGIRNRMLQVDGVESAVVISNRTSFEDASGRPPHSFEILVYPDTVDDEQVAIAVWEAQPSRRSWGSEEAEITDSDGQVQTVAWSYVEGVSCFVKLEDVITDNPPADWRSRVRAAIGAYINGDEENEDYPDKGVDIGEDVRLFRVIAAVGSVPGVEGATITIRRSDTAFGAADVSIGVRERARITVDDFGISIL